MNYEEMYNEYNTPVTTHVSPEYEGYDEDEFVSKDGELLELKFED